MSRSYQLLNRAYALIEKKAYRDARATLRVALREDSQNEDAWLAFLETCQRPSQRQRVIHHWLHCDPTNPTAQRLSEEEDILLYTLPKQDTSLRTWLRERTPILSLSTALVVIFLLSIWFFTTSRAVSAEVESTAAFNAPIDRSKVGKDVQSIQALNELILEYKDNVEVLTVTNGLLSAENQQLKDNQAALEQNLTISEEQNRLLNQQLEAAAAERDQNAALLEQAEKYPYTTVSNGLITLHHRLQDGTIGSFTIDYEEYEMYFGHINNLRFNSGTLRLSNNANMSGQFRDLSPFVKPESVFSIAQTLANRHNDEYLIIEELWNFVHQIEPDSKSIGEVPQFPLDTLIKGTGNLEDKSILLASLLAAAKPEWDVELHYTENGNVAAPQKPDYLYVFVGTPGEKYYIDASNQVNMQPFGAIPHDEWRIWSNNQTQSLLSFLTP